MSWEDGRPISLDLYYDPVEDEHVKIGSMGVALPAWYLAPQNHEIAMAGWNIAADFAGVQTGGKITGLEDPDGATLLLQLAGEFADPDTKQRLWESADETIEPTWDKTAGEFTLGLGLEEDHPRGQLNARIMAGWVCTKGAWSRIFNEPNLSKFNEPTLEGVDFPKFALTEARWDGSKLHVAAQGQNSDFAGTRTTFKLVNIDSMANWQVSQTNSGEVTLTKKDDHIQVSLVADNKLVLLTPH